MLSDDMETTLSASEPRLVLDELGHVADSVTSARISSLVGAVLSHARTFIFGTGRSGLMLKAFAMRLMQMGLTSYVVGETTTPSIQAGDLLVVASASGETGSVLLTARSALAQGADLLVITASPESSLARIKSPDVIIEAGSKAHASAASVQPLGSLFEQSLLLVFDSAILAMERRGTASNEDMAARHASLE
ncbi:6-phospho-3-hexuloisomerase [uncultured Parolsenella sp.]|uniref:6-phospho-3-hexuloisomerase n=1 Tax=uncultured Parolsenella sp. TaxID=2083008 RepID=UPI0027DDC958|nr:6-phospho-3-hexuloisomerase [uncultured Parolsenella sp.]